MNSVCENFIILNRSSIHLTQYHFCILKNIIVQVSDTNGIHFDGSTLCSYFYSSQIQPRCGRLGGCIYIQGTIYNKFLIISLTDIYTTCSYIEIGIPINPNAISILCGNITITLVCISGMCKIKISRNIGFCCKSCNHKTYMEFICILVKYIQVSINTVRTMHRNTRT